MPPPAVVPAACGDGGRERGTVGTVQSAAEDCGEYTTLARAQGTERGVPRPKGQAARGNASPAASHPTSPILGFKSASYRRHPRSLVS